MTKIIEILTVSILAAIIYGILHDLATALVCVEYFTIGHPKLIDSESPILLAVFWGVVATWWVGLILGGLLCLSSRAGPWPKVGGKALIPRIARLMIIMYLLAMTAWFLGFFASRFSYVWLVQPLANRVPRSIHDYFIADLWAHLSSYASGIVGGLIISGKTLYSRVHGLANQSVNGSPCVSVSNSPHK
jgi:hypothetical protein